MRELAGGRVLHRLGRVQVADVAQPGRVDRRLDNWARAADVCAGARISNVGKFQSCMVYSLRRLCSSGWGWAARATVAIS